MKKIKERCKRYSMYILVLLLMTVLIFKILFNNFGFMPNGEDKKKDEAINCFIKNISSNSTKTTQNTINSNNKKFFENIYENYTNRIKNISNKNNKKEGFDEELFKKTSEKAVITILDAFNNKDLKILEQMLTKDMLAIFNKNIKEMEEKQINYKTVVISFDEISILEKNFESNPNCIKVALKMKQINYAEDNEKNVVLGSKDKVGDIGEIWTFVKTDNNYWLLNFIN